MNLILVLFCTILFNVSMIYGDTKIKFYLMQKSKWNSANYNSILKSIVAYHASVYCSTKLFSCGLQLKNQSNIKDSNIVFASEYPKNDGIRYLDIKLWIYNPFSKILPDNETEAIVSEARNEINSNFSSTIVLIGSKSFSPSPPNLVNKILIPTSSIATLVLATTGFLLVKWQNQKGEKEIKKLAKQRKNKHRTISCKVTPEKHDQVNVNLHKTGDNDDINNADSSQSNFGFNTSTSSEKNLTKSNFNEYQGHSSSLTTFGGDYVAAKLLAPPRSMALGEIASPAANNNDALIAEDYNKFQKIGKNQTIPNFNSDSILPLQGITWVASSSINRVEESEIETVESIPIQAESSDTD